MNAEFLMQLSYVLLAVGCAVLLAAVILYRCLGISKAWRILFGMDLSQRRSPSGKEAPRREALSVETQRLAQEDTVVLYEETMIHTNEVI